MMVDVTGIEPVTPCLQRLVARRINELHGTRRVATKCYQVQRGILPETPIVMFTSYEAALEGFDVRKVGIDIVVPKDNLLLLVETVQGLLEEV